MTSVYSSFDARSVDSNNRRTLRSTKNLRKRTTVGLHKSFVDHENGLQGRSIERFELEKNAIQKLNDLDSIWS